MKTNKYDPSILLAILLAINNSSLAINNTSHSRKNFNYLLQFHLWNIPSVSVRSVSTLYSSKTVTSSSDIRAFVTIRVNTNTFSERSFSYAGPAVWNNLPQTLRHSDSSSSFKAALKTHLFNDYFYNRAVSDVRGVAVGVGCNVIVKRPAPQPCAVDGLSGNIFNV